MEAEIITIGDELLIGQVVDTNATFMAAALQQIGISVKRISSIGDRHQAIETILSEAVPRTSLILITGGLGPTRDDITKLALANYCKTSLRLDEATLQHIESLFSRRGRPLSELNRQQALVLKNATVIPNALGTAPGIWIEHTGCVIIAMPGVPFEMAGMMNDEILPRLKQRFVLPSIIHRTILTHGIPESRLAETLADWENNLPPPITLAYLPAPGQVRLRLSAKSADAEHIAALIETEVQKLQAIIPAAIFGYEQDTLEAVVGRLLRARRATLATAESCSGGYLAHLITTIPGSSDYFKGSIVAYANDIKNRLLEVDQAILDEFGAVSSATVAAMARGAQNRFQTDYALATSGIAGPGGGSPEKPVGTVWIGLATPSGCQTRQWTFGTDRLRNIEWTTASALNLLRLELSQPAPNPE
jgi:nicotinamide-nucleotide amidase